MLRFVVGFGIGAAVGAAVVVFTAPRAGPGLRRVIGETLQAALEVGRESSEAQEQALWAEFRKRLEAK